MIRPSTVALIFTLSSILLLDFAIADCNDTVVETVKSTEYTPVAFFEIFKPNLQNLFDILGPSGLLSLLLAKSSDDTSNFLYDLEHHNGSGIMFYFEHLSDSNLVFLITAAHKEASGALP